MANTLSVAAWHAAVAARPGFLGRFVGYVFLRIVAAGKFATFSGSSQWRHSMKSITRPMTGLRALLATVVAFSVLGPTISWAAEPTEDPAALAATYDKQAADLRAEAERHAKIARMHRGGAGSSKIAHDSIAQHCERMAENLNAAAKESEAVAEGFRSLAKQQQ